jgi:hypothetical protein
MAQESSLDVHRARLAASRHLQVSGETLRLCFGLEEIRASLGSDDPGTAAHPGYAHAGRSALTGSPREDRTRERRNRCETIAGRQTVITRIVPEGSFR